MDVMKVAPMLCPKDQVLPFKNTQGPGSQALPEAYYLISELIPQDGFTPVPPPKMKSKSDRK